MRLLDFPFIAQTRAGTLARFTEVQSCGGGFVFFGFIEGHDGPDLWRRDGKWRANAQECDRDLMLSAEVSVSMAHKMEVDPR